MKHILSWLLSGALLACLGGCVVPVQATDAAVSMTATASGQTATHAHSGAAAGAADQGITIGTGSGHDSSQVRIGPSNINITNGGKQIHIGPGGVSITNGPGSITVHGPDENCNGGREIVAIGHDASLRAGQNACDVVAIFGSATVHGNVSNSVVTVFGNSHIDGNVGNSAVAVLGSTHIDSQIAGNAVAVLGSVHLGPHALIGGQEVNILGSLEKSPGAVIQGGTVNLMSGAFNGVQGLQSWSEHCLLFGRLLAPRLDIGWAWGVALALLAFYVLLAALFHQGVQRCAQTLEEHPGPSILAALAMVMLTPILLLALVMTVVGIVVIPLFWLALLCAGIFGRVVALAWLGGRILRTSSAGTAQPVIHVLLGGALVLVLYMIPVLGFIVYAAIGLLGFGALIYTLVLAVRRARDIDAGTTPRAAPSAGPSSGAPAAAAPESQADPAPAGAAAAATSELELSTLPRAGFWLRMAALLIDVVLVGFALSLVGRHGTDGMLLILAGYGAIMWKLRGTTVGGIICNLRVVRLDDRPISWETSILRALGCFLSLVAAGLGFFWIAFDREHQAWHDKIAGTVVVLVPKIRGLV